MAARKPSPVVKLKPNPYGDHGAIRIRRVKPGAVDWMENSEFLVERVDAKGCADFRTARGHSIYDAAVKAAAEAAHMLRIPVADETGCTPAPAPVATVAPARLATKGQPPKAVRWAAKELQAKGIDLSDPAAFSPAQAPEIEVAFWHEVKDRFAGFAATFADVPGGLNVRTCTLADHFGLMALVGSLETRLQQLSAIVLTEREKSAGAMKYAGVWSEGAGEYQKGSVVTWNGGAWHANEPTTGKPGDDPAWKLAVKRGRDGRDGKDLRA